jgi:hypothetical protein
MPLGQKLEMVSLFPVLSEVREEKFPEESVGGLVVNSLLASQKLIEFKWISSNVR